MEIFKITKIDISAKDQNVSSYEVYESFKKFGEVQNIIKASPGEFAILFVSLSNGNKAQLQQSPITINNQEYAVKVSTNESTINRPNRIDTSISRTLLVPFDQESPMHIMNALNDDCLLEIFERLHPLDLYTATFVCKRFKQLAVYVFQTKYKAKSYFDAMRYGGTIGYLTLSFYENIFRTFGSIYHANEGEYNEDIVLTMLTKFCSNLERLKIAEANHEPQTIAAIRPILPKLKKLSACASLFADEVDADAEWQVEILDIHGHGFNSSMPVGKTPALKHLTFIGYEHFDEGAISHFLTNNNQIEKIDLTGCTFMAGRMGPLAEHMPNMRSLIIIQCIVQDVKSEPNINTSCRFPKLTRVLLINYSESGMRFNVLLTLLSGAPIEDLHLIIPASSGPIDYDVISHFASVTKLRILSEKPAINDEQFLKLTRSMTCLENLSLSPANVTFKSIANMLQQSIAIKNLKLSLKVASKTYTEDCDAISSIIKQHPRLKVDIYVYGKVDEAERNALSRYSAWLHIKPVSNKDSNNIANNV